MDTLETRMRHMTCPTCSHLALSHTAKGCAVCPLDAACHRDVVSVFAAVLPDVGVEIEERKGEPTHAKIWLNGSLVFQGRDYSADLQRSSRD